VQGFGFTVFQIHLPLLGGFLISAGLALDSIFYILAAIGMLGVLLTLLVPSARGPRELHSTSIEPSLRGKLGNLASSAIAKS